MQTAIYVVQHIKFLTLRIGNIFAVKYSAVKFKVHT